MIRVLLAALILAAAAGAVLLLAQQDRAALAQPAAAVEAPIAPLEAPPAVAKTIGKPEDSLPAASSGADQRPLLSLPLPAPLSARDAASVPAASPLPSARAEAADQPKADALPDIVRGGPTRPLKPHPR